LTSNIQLPTSLQEEFYEAFVLVVPRSSKLHDNVMPGLQSIGIDSEEEALTTRGYYINVLVEVNGVKIGIEIDGPSHLLVGN